MRKKTFIAIAEALLIVLTLNGTIIIQTTKANPWTPTPDQEKPTLIVESPQNYTAINDSNLLLNFSITKPDSWNSVYMFWHLVGDIISTDVYLDENQVSHYDMRNSSSSTSFSVGINQLTSGPHMINVTTSCLTYYLGPLYSNSSVNTGPQTNHGPVMGFPIVVSDTINFTVNPQFTPTWLPTPSVTMNFPEPTPSPTQQLIPTISILSPQNDSVFNVSMGDLADFSFPLTYETNTVLSWVGYSINGANNVTATGNSPLVHDFELSRYYTLTVYANDTLGNWAIPKTVTYLVYIYLSDYTPTPSPSPTQQPTLQPSPTPNTQENFAPILIIAGLIVVAVAVVAGALFYFKKRNAPN